MASTVTWRPTDQTAAWLAGRGQRVLDPGAASPKSLSGRTRVEIDLWREVLRLELADRPWSVAQLNALAAITAGTLPDDTIATATGTGLLYHCAVDYVSDEPGQLAGQFGIDEGELLTALRTLGPAADLALRDALARWWDDQDHDVTADCWRRHGLTLTPHTVQPNA